MTDHADAVAALRARCRPDTHPGLTDEEIRLLLAADRTIEENAA